MAAKSKNIIHFEYWDKKRAGVSLDINTGILKVSKRFEGELSEISAMIDGGRFPITAVREEYPFKDVEVENGNKRYRAINHCLINSNGVCLCSDSMDKLPEIDGCGKFVKGCLSHAQIHIRSATNSFPLGVLVYPLKHWNESKIRRFDNGEKTTSNAKNKKGRPKSPQKLVTLHCYVQSSNFGAKVRNFYLTPK